MKNLSQAIVWVLWKDVSICGKQGMSNVAKETTVTISQYNVDVLLVSKFENVYLPATNLDQPTIYVPVPM